VRAQARPGGIAMLRTAYELLKETASQWVDDKAPSRGAALAYYSMFAIAPIIILAVSLAGLIFGEDAAQGKVSKEVSSTVGPEVADAIQTLVRSASNPQASKVAAAVSLVIALFGAAGVFLELQDALNTLWKVPAPPGRPIFAIVKERFFSFAMVFSTGFLLLVSLVVSAALSAVAAWLTPESLPGGAWLWQAINALVSFAFI